jgi:spermidine/putrescine transport system permease protein
MRVWPQLDPKSAASLRLAAPAMLWLTLFVILPLLFMLGVSFLSTSAFGIRFVPTLSNYTRLFNTTLYAELLLKTLRISLTTTVITLLMAYPISIFLTGQRGQLRAILLLLLFLPFWIGYVVRTFAWLPILGRNGLINQVLMGIGVIDTPLDWLLYNEFAVYIGLVYVYLLFMIFPLFLSLDRIDPALYEAATDLGATPWRSLTRVTIPLSWPGALSGSITVFLLSFGAFVTPALLGGTSGILYSNVIATQFFADNNWAFGATLSVVMSTLVLVLLLVASRFIGLRRVFLNEPRGSA